ncbi:hypothetical protein [Aquamicrobium sp.]|uniref:hypothetical protein n=1 Tax=Aquamicrobium sp. TaxID=1872579 RepID=UPI00258DA3A9|nr:hypothetical protein [Aquamicrobium sp.]MCK9551588.1 hypothetical protein [Aquamicrobium sp.]
MKDAWRIEQDRQSQELAEIVQQAIDAYGQRLKAEGKQPMLNAVASAIVTVTGAMLASVKDRRPRKLLRNAMERELPLAIARHEGCSGSAEVIIAGRRADA